MVMGVDESSPIDLVPTKRTCFIAAELEKFVREASFDFRRQAGGMVDSSWFF